MDTGKYIKLQYDDDFRLVGARTEHFLLEKSRLVNVKDNERSYHILYQVLQLTGSVERENTGQVFCSISSSQRSHLRFSNLQ